MYTHISDVGDLWYEEGGGQGEWVAVSPTVGEVDHLGGEDKLPPYGRQVDWQRREAAGRLVIHTLPTCF